MSGRLLEYRVSVVWTGNRGTGTLSYSGYGREHIVRAEGKPDLLGSSDPVFRGDSTRYTPEDLLVAALSACHMLWYLHLCADQGVVVTDYLDNPSGTLKVTREGGGRFTEVVLRPIVTVGSGDPKIAERLHAAAHEKCFLANSVNFPVRFEPRIEMGQA
jgi:organic hydroperoxide reductase OsmC/OhrA